MNANVVGGVLDCRGGLRCPDSKVDLDGGLGSKVDCWMSGLGSKVDRDGGLGSKVDLDGGLGCLYTEACLGVWIVGALLLPWPVCLLAALLFSSYAAALPFSVFAGLDGQLIWCHGWSICLLGVS